MSHPFEVGKTYRNRNGEYVVQAIEGDWMKIRYVGGGTLETRISVQSRIWENIQFEEQLSREQERARLAREARMASRKRTTRARRQRAKPTFEGFQEDDFEAKTRGIAWSDRADLAKILAQRLSQQTQQSYGSWIVPRKSRVHVAHRDHYAKDARDTNAAFFVAVDEMGVTYGFRLGKPDGKAKAAWPWSVFVEALADDDAMRRAMRAAMKDYELTLDVYAMDVSYGQVGQVSVQDRGFLWEHETPEQQIAKRMNWLQLGEEITAVAGNKRGELFLRKRVLPQEALKAGAEIAEEIVTTFEALVPVYEASVGA